MIVLMLLLETGTHSFIQFVTRCSTVQENPNGRLSFSIGAMAHHQIVQAEFEPGVDKTLKADAF